MLPTIIIKEFVLVLAGCGTKARHAKDGEQPIYIYIVEGIELECISLHYRLSCNWEKYNKLNHDIQNNTST